MKLRLAVGLAGLTTAASGPVAAPAKDAFGLPLFRESFDLAQARKLVEGQYQSWAARGADHIPGQNSVQFDVWLDGAGQRRLQDEPVLLTGLEKPVSVQNDANGHVIVATKSGLIYTHNGWTGTPATVLLDLQAEVANYGDHGLTSILLHKDFLYATFMKEEAQWGDTCADYGAYDGRPLAQINGCKVTGRLVRFPYDALTGTVTGPEQLLIDGSSPADKPAICGQFSTHSMTCVILGPDGFLYVAAGDGAAFTGVDVGQMGDNPCADDPLYMGAFRSQNPYRINGKIIRLNPDDLTWELYATGVRNPFRLGVTDDGRILQSDTGWYTWEEINVIERGKNYGWPCYEGPEVHPDYANFNHPVCEALARTNSSTRPFYAYKHPEGAVGEVMSISGVEGWNNRIYWADHTVGFIKSMALDQTDIQTHCVGCRPCGFYKTPNGLVYVDHTAGEIRLVPAAGAPLASPSATPAPAFARAINYSNQTVFEPNVGATTWVVGNTSAPGDLYFGSETNLEGREGIIRFWTVSLLWGCAPGLGDADTTKSSPAPRGAGTTGSQTGSGTTATGGVGCYSYTVRDGYGGKSISIPRPPRSGTLEVIFKTQTFSSSSPLSTSVLYITSADTAGNVCTCAGRRIPVTDIMYGLETPAPGTGGGTGGGGTGGDGDGSLAGKTSGGADKSSSGGLSTGAIGGIAAGGAVVGIIVVGVLLLVAKVPQRLGWFGAAGAAAAGPAGAGTDGKKAGKTGTAGTAEKSAAAGSLASRRPGFSGASAVATPESGATAAQRTPAGANGVGKEQLPTPVAAGLVPAQNKK